MYPAVVSFELAEASMHLDRVVSELRGGMIDKDGASMLAVELAHILDHICRAWNCKDLTPEQKATLSQEEFERLSNTIPNFLGEKIIGEPACA